MGSDQLAGSTEAGKSQTSSSVAGVNRRTAVLFGNKTPRRSVARTVAQSPTVRRPGRPPKQHTHAVTESEQATENQQSLAREVQEPADEVVPKKRGRKKRSAVESAGVREFGSRWGEVVGSITTEWSTVARPQTTVSTRRTPQKESFRQYRVMHDSDAEGAPKSDNDHQMASVSSSSSSSESSDNNNSSSQSDNDDNADDGSSSSSSNSTTHSSGNYLTWSGNLFISVSDCLVVDVDDVNQATGYANQHIWCLSQARRNWEGWVAAGRASGVKMGAMMEVGH